ncbi:unnamed protein product [Acanthoscelides obtectus]|uniref:PiggyBac transposable element-derived protein domain-containing protein n=1 Tax=Acanthoscelides obtectus TaxID=200917 RepID=A0A9P0L9N8_ACAOB|nr:unnamed protein product [Acanthoscelides obtectus]CAK1680895.1 PiggyBac transposable element-derived protein 4 [Acanthoscelides obtectus]
MTERGGPPYYTDEELLEILMNSDEETSDIDENEVPTSNEDEVDETESDLEDDGPPEEIAKLDGAFSCSNQPFEPIIHRYNPATSELKNTFDPNSTPLMCFKQFFSEALLEHIVIETNRYADDTSQTAPSTSRQNKWKPTCHDELYVFLAVTILMVHTKKRKINDYWATDPLIVTPIFIQIISRDRYILLLRNLHFANNEEQKNTNDRLFKIRTVVDHLKAAFSKSLHPFQNLCIDESLMLFKGRIGYKQYIPSKRHRFGIKFFSFCDCKAGCTLDSIIYTGSNSNIQEFEGNLGKGANIVLTLIEPYMYKGHNIFLDNWYSSPTLFRVLHQHEINACGTVRANRSHMPPLKKTK